jgi:hypothetical protein
MNFEVYQLLVPLIGVFSISMTIKSHRAGDNTVFESFFWIFFWIGVSLVAIFPDYTTGRLSRLLGIKDNVNAIIFIGLAVSFFIHFRTFGIIKQQNQTITQLVRKIALRTEGKKEGDL